MPPAGLQWWGQGQAEHGDPAPTPFPMADLRELLREAQEGRYRATCGRTFPGSWDSLPTLSGGQDRGPALTLLGAGCRAPPGPTLTPGHSGLQMPLKSNFPILTLLEVPGDGLGVNPGSATYWLCDLGMIT